MTMGGAKAWPPWAIAQAPFINLPLIKVKKMINLAKKLGKLYFTMDLAQASIMG